MYISAPETKGRLGDARDEKLTRATFPWARVCNVDLARGVDVAQEPAWYNRDRVLLVVDVRHLSA